MPPVLDSALRLVAEAFEDLDRESRPLAQAIRKACRIARLRSDFENLLWLEFELHGARNKSTAARAWDEIRPHFSLPELKLIDARVQEKFTANRECLSITERGQIEARGDIQAGGVDALEMQLATWQEAAARTVAPPGLTPIDLYHVERERRQERAMMTAMATVLQLVLGRIRQSVHDFLSISEKELLFGKLNSDLFERNRQQVDRWLQELSPDASEKIGSVYSRLSEGDPEARAQVAASCRRVLKAVADAVYPPTETPVRGSDGRVREMTDEKYISRLWQFLSDRLGTSASGGLALSSLTDLGNRLDRAYDMSCKGLHSEISEFEFNQCVVSTYLLVGDILRLHDAAQSSQRSPRSTGLLA